MRKLILSAVVAVLSAATTATAQVPPPVPYGSGPSYNYMRAYHHFMTSPYSYRTMSSLGSGYAAEGPTPFGYQGTYVDPGYRQQRITPYGYENYTRVPGYGGYTVTPFGYQSYYTPGYSYQYTAPYPPPPNR